MMPARGFDVMLIQTGHCVPVKDVPDEMRTTNVRNKSAKKGCAARQPAVALVML